MRIELKNFEHCEGLSHETECFSASLWVDGKRIGTCENAGHGGPTNFDYTDRDKGAEFEAFCRSLPNCEPCEYFPEGLPMDEELFISELVEVKRQEQWVKRQTRNKVIFRLVGDEEGAWRTVKANKSQRLAAAKFIFEKYGASIVEIHPSELSVLPHSAAQG